MQYRSLRAPDFDTITDYLNDIAVKYADHRIEYIQPCIYLDITGQTINGYSVLVSTWDNPVTTGTAAAL